MRKLIFILLFGIILSCSPKIKSIIEYEKKGTELIPISIAEFDKNGNKVSSKNLGNSRSNRIITSEFENNRKIFEKSCDYFKSHDTCVVRSFSKFESGKKSGINKQTLFESDSAVRFIRETKRLKNIEIQKVYTWEFHTTKNPKIEDALILTDTVYYDNKDRIVKRIHYNSSFKEPWSELYKYYKNGYSKQTIGTAKDTIIKYKLTNFQKLVNRKKIDYKFYESETTHYEVENY